MTAVISEFSRIPALDVQFRIVLEPYLNLARIYVKTDRLDYATNTILDAALYQPNNADMLQRC